MSNNSSPQRTVTYLNTYRLEPKQKFSSDKVYKILKNVVEEAIENLTYDPSKCAELSQSLSETIKDKVKELNYERYKIVSVVTIGEKRCQDIYSILRFFWDPQRDTHAYYFEENMYVFILAMCFGVYYE